MIRILEIFLILGVSISLPEIGTHISQQLLTDRCLFMEAQKVMEILKWLVFLIKIISP